MSQGVSESKSIAEILTQNIPAALAVHPAHAKNDRNGTDWWVEMATGKMLKVDCKVREIDWAERGCDDLALESWSVVEKSIVGWTRDSAKQTDYVLWIWKDTGRWCLVPFPYLCRVFGDKWRDWSQTYKTARQFTPEGNYHSECVFVPRRELWAEIYKVFA